MRPCVCLAMCLGILAGCVGEANTVNPFLTFTEAFGISVGGLADGQAGAQGVATEAGFRQPLTITLRNNHSSADLEVFVAAWVNVNSVRTATQQESLLNDGYVQLTEEVRVGNAYTLPVGTYVYGGPGLAGATRFVVPPASGEGESTVPGTQLLELISPDVVLAFLHPPVSCDSVAFMYTRNGEPLEAVPAGAAGPFQGANRGGGFKTLAQVDVYQCDPFQPGLFIRLAGGSPASNEFLEGENITFDFYEVADANGYFAKVTFGETEEAETP